VRVVAGTYKGRTLVAPKGNATRPTSDRVREAIFSILVSVQDAAVLDLFAGSGALGIEAIRHNLECLGQPAEVLRMPAKRALSCTPIIERQYDLVFLDPPYRLADIMGPELSLALPPILAPEARVVAESDRRSPLVLELPLLRERQYGDTVIRVHGAR
jgi:16S rRNA (guanine966-N2)-methyltransferase